MKLIKTIVFSNLWIALCAGWLAFAVSYSLSVSSAELYGLAVGFSTIAVYNLHRLLRMPELSKSTTIRHKWLVNFSKIQWIVFVLGSLLSLFLFLQVINNLLTLVLIGMVIIISGLYAYKSTFFKRPLRELPYLKMYFIAISWTIMVLIIPLFLSTSFSKGLFLFVGVFTYFLAIIIPFDIRDLPYDQPHQKTLPQLIGVTKSKWAALLLLIISYISLGVVYGLHNVWLVIAMLYQGGLIIGINQKRKELYFAGLIDGGIFLFGLFWLMS